jgi:hypothetical protein
MVMEQARQTKAYGAEGRARAARTCFVAPGRACVLACAHLIGAEAKVTLLFGCEDLVHSRHQGGGKPNSDAQQVGGHLVA